MTDKHPITPPPELVGRWLTEAADLRPMAQSKAESALNALDHILNHSQTDHGASTIRLALQRLKELEGQ